MVHTFSVLATFLVVFGAAHSLAVPVESPRDIHTFIVPVGYRYSGSQRADNSGQAQDEALVTRSLPLGEL